MPGLKTDATRLTESKAPPSSLKPPLLNILRIVPILTGRTITSRGVGECSTRGGQYRAKKTKTTWKVSSCRVVCENYQCSGPRFVVELCLRYLK